MKKRLLLLPALLLLIGCKGPQGPAGPSGNAGSPGTGVQTYSMSFMEGSLPFSSYTGTLMETADAANPTTSSATGFINFSPANSSATRFLMRWPIKGFIPINATVVAASVQLVTSSTSPGTAKVVGVHQMFVDPSTLWTTAVTWDQLYPGVNWSGLNAGPATFTAGNDYTATPMSTITIGPTQASGTRLGWPLSTSLVQTWINPALSNNGVVFTSEAEGTGESAGSITFGNPASAVAFQPVLVVQYTIP